MKDKILITGTDGFIGRNLYQELKSKYEIDYHYDGKTNGTKKHPKTKNKNTLSKYEWNCNIE